MAAVWTVYRTRAGPECSASLKSGVEWNRQRAARADSHPVLPHYLIPQCLLVGGGSKGGLEENGHSGHHVLQALELQVTQADKYALAPPITKALCKLVGCCKGCRD